MLEFQLLDPDPLLREGVTCKFEGIKINVPDPVFSSDFCFCDFECDSNLIAFAGTIDREKDYFTLYHNSKDPDATVQFFINDTELVDVIHGTAISNGFIVDFTKIFSVLGGGSYLLKTTISEFGSDLELSYGKFDVMPFSELMAEGTVKIESFQNGSIESYYDFGNENVPFSIRVFGILGNENKVKTSIITPNNSREDIQAHERWHYEYECIFTSNKHGLSRFILDIMMSSDKILFSDYNKSNMTTDKPFNKLHLREVETETEHILGTNTTKYTLSLEESIKNNVKHPYL